MKIAPLVTPSGSLSPRTPWHPWDRRRRSPSAPHLPEGPQGGEGGQVCCGQPLTSLQAQVIDKLRRRSPCWACAAIGQAAATEPRDELPPSFDHLVGESEQVPRNGKAKHLGGIEIHGHLKFCRHLNG